MPWRKSRYEGQRNYFLRSYIALSFDFPRQYCVTVMEVKHFVNSYCTYDNSCLTRKRHLDCYDLSTINNIIISSWEFFLHFIDIIKALYNKNLNTIIYYIQVFNHYIFVVFPTRFFSLSYIVINFRCLIFNRNSLFFISWMHWNHKIFNVI